MMSKKIILTFDYELFLYKSGTITNCIINPVKALTKELNNLNIKAVFFIDILYLRQLKALNLHSEFNQLKTHIQSLISEGHSIELHIHSHWIDAVYDKEIKQWDLSNTKNYNLNALTDEEARVLFAEGYNLLTEIGKEVNQAFKISAFRAGGLCIQPFKLFAKLFNEFNIQIDSSVAPGLISKSKAQAYDFSNAPNKSVYNFNDDPCTEIKAGPFVQLPILHYNRTFFHKIFNKFGLYKNKSAHNKFGDGEAYNPGNSNQGTFLSKLKPSKYLFSLDGEFNQHLLISKIKQNPNSFLTILSHPKSISQLSLETIKVLHNNDFEFITYNNILTK